MGNRLTLPLLLLALLLAGGAFFWMSGGERGGVAPKRGPAERAKPSEERPAAELATPELPLADQTAPGAPARVELAQAKEPVKAPKAKSQGSVKLTGQVVDRFGAPVAGARVTAATDAGFPLDLELEREFPWLKRQRTETDVEGRFRFEDVEPGSVQLAVRASGFAPYGQRGVAVPATDTELAPIVVARGAILSGIVVDPDGRPVADARIGRAEIEDEGALFMIGEREAAAVTGADGRFRVDQLACGAWRFVVRSEDHPDLTVEGMAEEPGVEVSGLRWQLTPGATIAGTVTGVPSAERGQLEVRAMRGGSQGLHDFMGFGSARVAKVETSGSFLLRGLDPGASYTLQARHARAEGDLGFFERSRSESVQASAGDTGVVLAYQPEAALVFNVFDAKTRAPLESFQVESGLDWRQPLRDDQGRPRTRYPGGAVRVGGLRPRSEQDRVQLGVKAAGYRDYDREDIAVRSGQELDLGAIYLEPVPVVRVHVLDAKSGEPVADASVRMQKQQGDSFQVRRSISISEEDGHESIDFGEGRSATTDEHGWAVLTSYEGDTVELSARAKGYAPAKLEELALPRGESLERELRLSLGGEALVRVLDPEGLPQAGTRVEHRASGGPEGGVIVMGGPRQGGVVTDSEGQALFTNLSPGVHSFRLAEDGGGGPMFATADSLVIAGMGGEGDDDWSELQVNEGERAELTLRAAPRAGLTGRVREAGKILAGATLRLEKEGAGDDRPRFAMPGMGGDGPEAKSDGEGRYHIADVKEGRYTLTVTHPTRRMPEEFAVELREGENSFDVELALSIVSGRVLDEQGKGLPGVRVWPERRAPEEGGRRMRFVMVMADDSGGGMVDTGQFGERALTDADGNYSLRGVTSDADLVIKAEGDRVQPGESGVVRVAPNEVKDGVDLALAAAGSILVQANLPDGAPARFQLVQAEYLGEEQPKPEPKFTLLQQGSTELKGLKPGLWKVNVRSADEGPRGSGGQDQEVKVLAGETATATFEVE